jgi:hypothetical protein
MSGKPVAEQEIGLLQEVAPPKLQCQEENFTPLFW